MKKLLFIALFFISTTCPSQGVLDVSWFVTQDGPQNQFDVAWGLDTDEAGNSYWSTSQSINGFDVKDIYTYKVDPDGNFVWPGPHIQGGLYEQQAYNLRYKNGVAYVGGRTWTGYFSLAFSDALVYAIDTLSRDTLWTYTWDGGFGYEEVDGMVIEDDGIYISGWTQGEFTNQDAFISKLDLNGNLQWTTTWGSPNYDQCDGHCIVDDSLIYICGLYDLSTNAGNAYLAAFDKTDGTYKWHSEWGGNGIDDALGMNSDGNFLYLCGTTSSHGDSLVFINKYDKAGNLIWNTLTNKAIKSRSLDFDNGGNLYLAATGTAQGAGLEDIIIMKFNSANGMLQEYRTWGGSENESVQDIVIQDGYMHLTGRTKSFSQNNFEDALLIKAPLFGSVSNQNPVGKNWMAYVYPNPTEGQFRIDFRDAPPPGTRLQITNAKGQPVLECNATDQTMTFPAETWKPGTYYILINGTCFSTLVKI